MVLNMVKTSKRHELNKINDAILKAEINSLGYKISSIYSILTPKIMDTMDRIDEVEGKFNDYVSKEELEELHEEIETNQEKEALKSIGTFGIIFSISSAIWYAIDINTGGVSSRIASAGMALGIFLISMAYILLKIKQK